LQQFDAGYRFDPEQNKSFPFRGQGIKIPAFEELLMKFPGKFWCVEIKQNSAELVHESVKLLLKHNLMNVCVIGSKHHLVSDTMRRHYAGTPRFFSQREIVLSYLDFKRGATPAADPDGVASLPIEKKCGMDFTEPGYIRYLHDKKVRVYYWTVNDSMKMDQLARRGADGLISDDPASAVNFFQARN
jgi:glycerophosphoryl diester phosphodiesterase